MRPLAQRCRKMPLRRPEHGSPAIFSRRRRSADDGCGRVWAAPTADMRIAVVVPARRLRRRNVVIPGVEQLSTTSHGRRSRYRGYSGSADVGRGVDPDWGCIRRSRIAAASCGRRESLPSCRLPAPPTMYPQSLRDPGHDRACQPRGHPQLTIRASWRGSPRAHPHQADRLYGAAAAVFRGASIPNIGIAAVGKPGVDDRPGQADRKVCTQGRARRRGIRGLQGRDDVYKTVWEEMTAADRGQCRPRASSCRAGASGGLMRDSSTSASSISAAGTPMWGQGAPPLSGGPARRAWPRRLSGFAEEIGPQA